MNALLLALLLTGLDGGAPVDAGGVVDAGSVVQAGAAVDAGAVVDAGPAVDAGAKRAGKGKGEPFTLLATGDVTLGYHLEELLDEKSDAGVPRAEIVAYPFAGVAERMKAADLAVVNLECPFTERGEKLPKNFNFRARREWVEVLKVAGIDAVTLANNHLKDYGPEGVEDTVATLDAAGIAHTGAGKTLAEARKPALLDAPGGKVALLGYLYLGEQPIEPAAVWATADTAGVAGTAGDLEAMREMVKVDVAAARKLAPRVVVFFHFGKEGTNEPQPYQVTLAHDAAEAGAALVLGAHPHVLQGAERWQGVPVVYSLGNFVFGGNSNPRKKESAFFEATFQGPKVVKSQFVPVRYTRVPEAPFQPQLLEGEERAAVLRDLARYSRDFPEPLVK